MSRIWRTVGAIVALVVLTATSALAASFGGSLTLQLDSMTWGSSATGVAAPSYPGWTVSQLEAASPVPIPDQEAGIGLSASTRLGSADLTSIADPSGTTEILVSLDFSNGSRLIQFLNNLSNPASPEYHHYLTHTEFDANFGGSPAVYGSLVRYFEAFDVTQLTTHPDRLTISFQATASQISAIFHADLDAFISPSGQRYFAPLSLPTLPSLVAPYVTEVQGLSNYSEYLNHADSQMVTDQVPATLTSTSTGAASNQDGIASVSPGGAGNPFASTTVNGLTYDQPIHKGTAGANCDTSICGQLMFGPDLQVAYNETGLFAKYGYPANATLVALLWSDTISTSSSGTDGTSFCQSGTAGDYAWDFFMPDITAYWNYTLPSGELMPRAISMPQTGSSSYYYPSTTPGDQGYSSTCDSGGAEGENTLDVAMEGSMAPGANVIQVFGQGASTTSITTGLSDILSPASSEFSTTGGFDTARNIADLANASVIANSWTSSGSLGAAWSDDLAEAQALGITVLASSGDGGGNSIAPPAEAAYNTYGDVAVGGTTLALNATTLMRTADHLFSSSSPYDGAGGGEVVWYEPSGTVYGFSSTYGTTGGVAASASYYAPKWQNSSADAHGVITGIASSGYGRAEPDIAAIANDTEIDFDEGEYSFNITCIVTSSCTQVSKLGDGTEIGYTYFVGTSISDQVVGGMIGTIDYALTKMGEARLGFLDPAAYSVGQLQYTGDLTLHSFKDITLYHNAEPSATYGAFAGWDADTGWGAIDAGNFTQNTLTYPITITESGLPSGAEWSITIKPEVGDAGCVVSGGVCTNTVTTSSTTTTITFNEPFGTYTYTLNPVAGYIPSLSAGTVEVNGATVSVRVTFTEVTYSVTFTESGLPASTPWSITFGASEESTAGTSLSFTAPNGTYSYEATPPIDYTAAPASGMVVVDGANEGVSISMTTVVEGGNAIAELYSVYNARPDLQTAFPDAYTSSTNFDALVSWAGRAVGGAPDSSYSMLAPYGYWYALMETYNERPDLQAAFPGAYASPTSYDSLIDWAGNLARGLYSDGAYSTLAPFGYWYVLMETYNLRSDLQSAFPDAYTSSAEFDGLVTWAGGVVTQLWTDGAYTAMVPYGYWYALMRTYNERPDLEAAFPNAYTEFTSYTDLVDWAGGVVTQVWVDGAYSELAPFGYYYDLMNVYEGRVDLQSAFPCAFTDWISEQALVTWAGMVVSGVVTDGANATLQPYGYWYALMGMVYNQRPDLQAAFPLAWTDEGSYQGLLAWAKDVVENVFPDGAYSVLLPYAAYYEANG